MTNIRNKVFEDYHTQNWEWLPDVICLGCHRAVFNAAANNAAGHTVSHIDFSNVRAPATMSARSTTVESRVHECKCSICWIGRMDFNEYRAFEKQMKEPVGRPRIHPDEEPEAITVCSKCHAEIGRGRPHNNCNETGRKQNVIAVINEGDERGREQILAEQLRAVMSEKGATNYRGVPTGAPVTIATTGGRGGKLEVAAAPSNLQKPPVRFTLEGMMRVQLKMGTSDRGTLHMARFLRVNEGRDSVEPGLQEALIARNTRYEHFFDQKPVTFTEYYTPEGEEEKKKKKEIREVTKPMAFCTDVDGLAAEVLTQRGLDPARTKIQIGIDDGELNTIL